jgi:hypothetical protein
VKRAAIKRGGRVSIQARLLREAACEWAAHAHEPILDDNDSASKKRWYRLARAAYEYARHVGAIPGIPAER